MKTAKFGTIAVALLLATLVPSTAATLFADSFGNGSTLNSANPGTPTSAATAYEAVSGKTWNPPPSIVPGHLQFGITNTGGGSVEIQAQFPPVPLLAPGGYVQLNVTFTDVQGALTQSSFLGMGLYNSGGTPPIGGGLNGTATFGVSTTPTGGAQNWQGYVAIVGYTGLNSGFYDRQAQIGTANNNQELVTIGSSSLSYQHPPGTVIGSASTAASLSLAATQQYTEVLTYTLSATGALLLTNQLYAGPDSTGTLLSMMTAITGTTPLTTTFDSFALGIRSTGNLTNTLIDINSITVTGSGSSMPPPPPITAVVVATNGSCAFSVSVVGLALTYQWHRNGTNLLNGGNITGANSAMLVISPAGTADAASGANGYYVTITDVGNNSINSTTNSLTLDLAASLTWSGNGSVWDVSTTTDWLNGADSSVFNYGDNVTFDDSANPNTTVTVSGSYVSAGSVTVSNNNLSYTFQGAGSIAGPGKLIYEGSNTLEMNCANTYSGGTIITNPGARLLLDIYSGLGSGPITFAKAGGRLEVVPGGSTINGLAGDIVVADDGTVQFDGNGTFSGVFFGNLTGTAGKTLTLTPKNVGSTNRFRVYGTNTVYNANLVLGGTATSQANYNGTVLACYESSGSQTYNGVISGNGGLIQRDVGTTILNGANTFHGGTTPTVGMIALGSDTIGAVTAGPVGTGPLYLAPEIPLNTGSGGIMAWNGARTIANPVEYPSATNNLTLIIGGTNALTLTGAITLNGNDGSMGATNRTFQITNTALTTFAGVINDNGAGMGLTKTGSGTLALNNHETYTGPTSIASGTLLANGQLTGPVTVNGGATLAPGTAGATGTLTISNTLTINGNLFFKINKAAAQSNDLVRVSGALTNGGTGILTITNLGPSLVAGDRFTLFTQALPGGSSLTISGGGSDAMWINNLTTDGSITVQSTCGPTIQSQPMGQAVANGSMATLSVIASTLTTQTNYQWLHNGTNLAGQTGRTLVVTNLHPEDLGSYAVLVDDSTCSTLSYPANITAAISPVFFNPGISNSTVRVSFPTEIGPNYFIEMKQNLDDALWIPVTNYPGDGSMKFFITPMQGQPQSFFRVRVR